MLLPDYWLPRPDAKSEDGAPLAFDDLLRTTLATGGCPAISYDLPWPKWQFLCHAADHHAIAMHGSSDPDIAQFEPRQSNDLNDFGNQTAIYAASDGLWAMFFAIVDRERHAMSVTNACIRVIDAQGVTHGPYYEFSVSGSALLGRPWRTGTVYLLPRATFVSEPPISLGGNQVHIAQLASFVAVEPLAKMTVAPSDFPFLARIRGHDDARLAEYARALQTGAAWPDDAA